MKSGADIDREDDKLKAANEQRAEHRKRTGGIDPNRTRFWMKPGDSAEVVILDVSVETVAFYEHHMKKDGKWGNFESCPGEWSNCPLCTSGDHKSFVWLLTILDTRGYTKDNGDVVEYQRRLLPIKQTQSIGFKRVLKAAEKEFGTTKGVVMLLERDTSDRSASIGEPVMMDNGKMFDFLDDGELLDEFGHQAIKTSKGDVLIKKNGLLEAFDYAAAFPKPNAKDIAKRWGMDAPEGSDDEYEEEAKVGRATRSSRKSLDDDDEDYDDDDDEEEEDEPAKKSRGRSMRSLKDFDDDEDEDGDEDEEDDEEEEPVPRRKSKKSASKATKKKAKNRRVDDDDDDDDIPF
jgi:hypothetical protein